MIEHKKKCPMCGEKFIVRDIKNPAKNCGRRVCVTNREYQERHTDLRTGYKPEPEDIKKWH